MANVVNFKRVIIDVDVGTDDAVALLIFLYAMKLGLLKIEAIICTSGNTGRENVVRNLVRILEIVGYRDIPIYRGSLKPFVSPIGDILNPIGSDGFGDLSYSHEPDISIVRKTFGAKAMYELVKQSPKEVSIIALAPLTNIAFADRLYDDFMINVKDIWIMGGNLIGRNKHHATSEFNFFMDPEAAYILLNDTRKETPLYILPSETCSSSPITMKWRFDELEKSPLPIMRLINKAEKNVFQDDDSIWKCCDGQIAAAYVYEDRIVKSFKNYSLSVELHGSQTRGQLTVYNDDEMETNAIVIEAIDYNFFKKVLLNISDISNDDSCGNVSSLNTRLVLSLVVIFLVVYYH